MNLLDHFKIEPEHIIQHITPEYVLFYYSTEMGFGIAVFSLLLSFALLTFVLSLSLFSVPSCLE